MRIACWQAGRRPVGRGFVACLRDVVAEATDAGATLLVTPELSATGYQLDRARTRQLAEPADGPLRDAVSLLAAANSVSIVYGWPEAADGVIYNSVHLIDADGRVAARYRKTHLYGKFDASVFARGHEPVVQAKVGGYTVGLIICYDIEFPELVRAHALAGTELLAVPTALSRPWEFVARTLVPTRAFESQLFIAYVNWTDTEPDGYCGLSRLVGPDGIPLAEATTSSEAVLIGHLDPVALAAARLATPYLVDRRPDLYGGLVNLQSPTFEELS